MMKKKASWVRKAFQNLLKLAKIRKNSEPIIRSRAGNNNIGMLQFLNLEINSHPTVNSCASYARLMTLGFDSLMNLLGQFTSGGGYQNANTSVFTPHQSIEYRQNECCRFTGAALGQTHYITTIQNLWDCPRLNRGRGFITHRCNAWAGHIISGGYLLVHDIFTDPANGGQAPYQVYNLAIASGLFREIAMVKSLGVLQRQKCGDIPANLPQ